MSASTLLGAVGAGLGFFVAGPLGAVIGGKLGYSLGDSVDDSSELASGDDPGMSVEHTEIDVTQTETYFDITDLFG